MKRKLIVILLCGSAASVMAAGHMASDRISDIRNTKHNFASSDMVELPNGALRKVVSGENQVCVFCHTPHGDHKGAPGEPGDPIKGKPMLWNRADSVANYTGYSSTSLDVAINAGAVALGNGSKMCLSCHDGTVAIGQVDVINGQTGTTVSVTGDNVTGGVLNAGTDGNTSNLGVNLSNDHPVGFKYTKIKADADGELADPDAESYIGIRVGSGVANFNQNLVDGGGTAAADNPTSATTRIAVPLESAVEATPGPFVTVATDGSVECTTCHDPHIRSTDNTENIKFLRLHRFQKTDPVDGAFAINSDINCLACHKKKGWAGSAHANELVADNVIGSAETTAREFPAGTKVWEASCLSCHDTHTVTGASHLLVKDDTAGTSSDVDQTCYQCHGNTSILEGANLAANIEAVEISNPHGSSGIVSDTHDILSGDFDETSTNLKSNRHSGCTDCHNPHRTQHYTKYDVTDSIDADNSSALHKHESGIVHSNIASGALSGISGVEPGFDGGLVAFDPYATPTGDTYTVLKGDATATAPVTKEYQVCLKCHSEAGATIGNPAVIGNSANIAVEFSPLLAKSYHPVIQSADDNNFPAEKGVKSATANVNLVSPFGQGKGVQTMYCSDCHANDNALEAKGPHGSGVAKLLKGNGDTLCVECHDVNQYQKYSPTTTSTNSGFSCVIGDNTDCIKPTADINANNLHVFHAGPNGTTVDNVCSDCHVVVPHGWRNKALLANNNDVDVEGLKTRYYPNSKNTITTMPASSTWKRADCTTACHI